MDWGLIKMKDSERQYTEAKNTEKDEFRKENQRSFSRESMSPLLVLGKLESGGGPIFKVVKKVC